ncbi:MAG: hypothetical protein AAFV69_00170 [Pseudomonadota bacterium]
MQIFFGATQNLADATQNPADTTQNPVDATQNPADATQKAADATLFLGSKNKNGLIALTHQYGDDLETDQLKTEKNR